MNATNIKLYGAARCHKTQHYIQFLKLKKLGFQFYDVEKNEAHAAALRQLYESQKLNFPTLLIKDKKLRNPSDKDLEKWLIKKDLLP